MFGSIYDIAKNRCNMKFLHGLELTKLMDWRRQQHRQRWESAKECVYEIFQSDFHLAIFYVDAHTDLLAGINVLRRAFAWCRLIHAYFPLILILALIWSRISTLSKR